MNNTAKFRPNLTTRFGMAADAPQTRRARFRVLTLFARGRTWRTNGTLDSNEIPQECVVTFDEQHCQVSSESNEPFRNGSRCAPNPTRAISGTNMIAGLPPIAATLNRPSAADGYMESIFVYTVG